MGTRAQIVVTCDGGQVMGETQAPAQIQWLYRGMDGYPAETAPQLDRAIERINPHVSRSASFMAGLIIQGGGVDPEDELERGWDTDAVYRPDGESCWIAWNTEYVYVVACRAGKWQPLEVYGELEDDDPWPGRLAGNIHTDLPERHPWIKVPQDRGRAAD